MANARTVTLPDGRQLFGGFQSTPGAPASGGGVEEASDRRRHRRSFV